MTIDIKEKEEKNIAEEKEKQREPGLFSRVPTMYILAGVAVIVLMYLRTSSGHGSSQEFWTWTIAVFVMWWLLGRGIKAKTGGLLTPEEADILIKKEINRMRNEDPPQIARFSQVYLGPDCGLRKHEALPRHYLKGMEVHYDGVIEYKRIMCYAEGEERGFVTIANNPGKFQGTEAIPVISPIPKQWRRLQEAGFNIDRMLFGPERRP